MSDSTTAAGQDRLAELRASAKGWHGIQLAALGFTWPLCRGEPDAGGEAAIAATSRQLTRGLLMTFLSIAALALATATSWWPKEQDGGGASGAAQVQVEVRTDDGQTACGELGASPRAGTLRVVTDAQPLDVALASVASVAPVGSC